MSMERAGISEILGTIVLIGLMVAGIIIVNMVILSQPIPARIPALEATITNNSTLISMTHQGGDTLRAGEYRIMVDGQDRTSLFKNSGGISPSDLNWSVGETLYYNAGTLPNRVVVVYNGTGTGGGTGGVQILSTKLPWGVNVAPYANTSTPTPPPAVQPPTTGSPPWQPSPPWYNCLWPYRKNITINKNYVTGNPSPNFPVYIDINNDNDLNQSARPDGYDIFFTDNQSKAVLPFEREYFNKVTGSFSGWVSVSGLSSSYNTTIFMYFNNSNTFDQSDRNDVWDADYEGVWHLEEDAAGANRNSWLYNDSTSNNRNGNDNVTDTVKTGKLDYGQNFTRKDNISLGTGCLNSTTGFTLEAWVNVTVGSTSYGTIFMQGSSACPSQQLRFEWWDSGTNHHLETCNTTAGYCGTGTNATANIADNTWTYVTWTNDPIKNLLYLNGQSSNCGSGCIKAGTTQVRGNLFLGSNTTLDGFWQGGLDEIRVSDIARSPAWINTTYWTENDPAHFTFVNTTEHWDCVNYR